MCLRCLHKFENFPLNTFTAGKHQYTNNVTFDNGHYNASWLYNAKTDTLHFKIMTYAVGWVGFGIAENGTMAIYDLAAGGVYANKSCYLKVCL